MSEPFKDTTPIWKDEAFPARVRVHQVAILAPETVVPVFDLVVCGSVAVNRQGARNGKGGGFSDLEVAFLVEAGVIRRDTVLATTVYPLQLVDEPLPETIHDFRADLIVTPDETIWCTEPHRPPGILFEHLQQDKIAEVPILGTLAARR